jgi:hypothetical protein
MNSISAGDYVSHDQHEIFAGDINDRIEQLRKTTREARQDGDEPFDEDVAELDALVEFRDQVQVETGNHFDEATIVPADQFEEHARDFAHGIADIEFLDTYVDWPKFGDDLKSDRYIELELGDSTVYVR